MDRKCRYDKENANTSMKACARWSLGGDVGTNPPLLADMGLAVLQDEEASCHAPSPSPFSNIGHVTSASPSHKVSVAVSSVIGLMFVCCIGESLPTLYSDCTLVFIGTMLICTIMCHYGCLNIRLVY